ncbi:hypothetical protein ANCCEY_12755 [Ancylostoma ceylanicum]|uniref:Uncharacterized protein n=1 Tax=Ancylostoma ceylanicum TaxID=53326 RepID=A0A0D6LDZ5_9BILA|nr:hypothetical protein ANCCEY_12755 [Ancylostoma ceylanicum]
MFDHVSGEVTMDDTDESSAVSTTTRDPLDGHISPLICKDGIINNLEGLLNYIASGWKYHVSNTDGVKQAWSKFDNVTNKICSFMTGAFVQFLRTCAQLSIMLGSEKRYNMRLIQIRTYDFDYVENSDLRKREQYIPDI